MLATYTRRMRSNNQEIKIAGFSCRPQECQVAVPMQLWHCQYSLILLLTICRCLRDNTVNYNYTLSSVQRFSLKTFNFRLLKSDEVYLHCQVTACLRSDLSSRCAQGCPYGRRRKRNTDKELEQYLGIGPIIVSTKDSDVHDKTGTFNSGGT